MKSVFWILVRNQAYLLRGLIMITLTAGVLALFIMTRGKAGFAVGGILYLTTLIASGLFISSFTTLQDRKDQSRMFALSLPVSGRQYELAKFTGAWLSFGIPWLILATLGQLMFLAPPAAEKGLFVYALLIHLCILAINSVFIGVMTAKPSEPFVGPVVLVVNMIFSLFMVTINQPQFIGRLRGPVIHWPQFAVTTLIVEVLVIVLPVAFALHVISRKRDYV